MLTGGAPACETDCPNRRRHLLLSRFPGMIGKCIHVLLHLHIRCAREWEQNSQVVGPLSSAGKTDAGYYLASSLTFCLKGMTQEIMLELGSFVGTVSSSAPQFFLLIHTEFSSQHCGALGAAWGTVSTKATRMLLIATHIYNKVDRL